MSPELKAVPIETKEAEIRPEDYEIPDWLATWFDQRQIKQIEFSLLYSLDFHHGADGHNSMMIIARLVQAIKAQDLAPGHVWEAIPQR